MNKLNPIYLLALIATIFIISMVMQINKKNDFQTLSKEQIEISSTAKKFNEYKTTWFDKNTVQNRLDKILKNPSFRNEKVLRFDTPELIKVKIESNKPSALEQFLNRVLNDKFIIKKLQLEKDSIYLEIGYK